MSTVNTVGDSFGAWPSAPAQEGAAQADAWRTSYLSGYGRIAAVCRASGQFRCREPEFCTRRSRL
jgi:hypothetical protein